MSNYESKNLAPEELERFAGMFKALANPHRLKVLLELLRCSPDAGQFVADVAQVENCQRAFAEELGLAPSTVSHHFKEMRQAGLLHMRREGKRMLVWIDADAIRSLRHLLG